MPLKPVETIWMNGKLVKWADAKIHVLSHVVHYGSSWFEGIRCYDTKRGPAIFRLEEHLDRLRDSCRIYHAEIPYTKRQLEDAVMETVRANKMKACYIRPVVYRGYGDLGVNPLNNPVDVADRGMGLGIIPRRRSAYSGNRRLRFFVVEAGAQYATDDRQVRRKLPQWPVDQNRSSERRVQRGYRSRRFRPCERGGAEKMFSSSNTEKCTLRRSVPAFCWGLRVLPS